jgi:hypothetical protein
MFLKNKKKLVNANLKGSEFLFSTIWLRSSLQSCFHCLGLTGLSAVVAAAAVLLLPDFRRLPFSACRSGLHTQENTLQHRETKQSKGEDITCMFADQHHFQADPDPDLAFHINA